MSISPPGDLVLDVMRAADPASVTAARDRLASGVSPASTTSAKAVEQSFRTQFDKAASTHPAKAANNAKAPEAYRKFEAMVLQTFIKEMLPKDSQDVYGKGTAGDIWKGMLAQQMATVISRHGGIGIADNLLRGRSSGLGLAGAPQARLSGENLNISHGLVQQLQMKTFDDVMPLDGKDDANQDGRV